MGLVANGQVVPLVVQVVVFFKVEVPRDFAVCLVYVVEEQFGWHGQRALSFAANDHIEGGGVDRIRHPFDHIVLANFRIQRTVVNCLQVVAGAARPHRLDEHQ